MIRFRVGGVVWELSVWYLALLTLLSLYDQTTAVLWGVCASLFHEACHLAVLCSLGGRPRKVALELTGMRMVQPVSLQQGKQALVLAAGCAGNLLLFFCCMRFGWLTGATVNLCLCLFNLLPCRALDGGQLLALAVCRKSPAFGERFCRVVSICLAALLLVLGGWLLVRFGNPTLLLTGLFVLCA